MLFEERELPLGSQNLSADELRVGAIYFAVNYFDRELLIPGIEPVVYIGKDLEPGDSGQVYFQDLDSYRDGVRYGAASGNEHARFFTGSELELGHLFDFDRALEELMRCSVRRRERFGKQEARGARLPEPEQLPPASGEAPSRTLRFDNDELQARFVSALSESAVPFARDADGAVVCSVADWPSVNSVAHTIRDRCFRWYLSWWKDAEAGHRFWREMRESGLPFQVEYHDRQTVFLLPKGSEDLHETIIKRVQGEALASRG